MKEFSPCPIYAKIKFCYDHGWGIFGFLRDKLSKIPLFAGLADYLDSADKTPQSLLHITVYNGIKNTKAFLMKTQDVQKSEKSFETFLGCSINVKNLFYKSKIRRISNVKLK